MSFNCLIVSNVILDSVDQTSDNLSSIADGLESGVRLVNGIFNQWLVGVKLSLKGWISDWLHV